MTSSGFLQVRRLLDIKPRNAGDMKLSGIGNTRSRTTKIKHIVCR